MRLKSIYIIIILLSIFTIILFLTQNQPESGHIDFAVKELTYTCTEESDTKDNKRNMAWEQDILFLRTFVLQMHPIMRDVEIPIEFTQRFRDVDTRRTFYDEELKEQFIEYSDKLIEQIPYLSDFEIQVWLSRLLALLGDSHTSFEPLAWQLTGRVPFDFWRLCGGWYVWRAYQGFEEVIFSRLEAVGGVDVDELLELLRPIIPHENDAFLGRTIDLFYKDILVYLNVIDAGDTMIPLMFTNIEGYTFTIDVPFIDWNEIVEAGRTVDFTIDTEKFISHFREDEYYWFEYFPDESLMYVRFRVFGDNRASMVLWNELIDEVRDSLGIDTLVLDLRGNGGGIPLWGFDSFLRWAGNEANHELMGTVFIVVDRMTYSRGVIAAAQIKTAVEDAIIIGQPTSGLPNTFGGAHPRYLPNSNTRVRVSSGYIVSWPDYEGNTLTPDIHIPRTIEDYMNSHDAVLAFIRAYGRAEQD